VSGASGPMVTAGLLIRSAAVTAFTCDRTRCRVRLWIVLGTAPSRACLPDADLVPDDALMDAIMAGAARFVLKQIRGTDLIGAVRTVASGQSTLDPGSAGRVMARLRGHRGRHRRAISDSGNAKHDFVREIKNFIPNGIVLSVPGTASPARRGRSAERVERPMTRAIRP